MIRRASDLVSKFVGETEQQMAAMFREAEGVSLILERDAARAAGTTAYELLTRLSPRAERVWLGTL